MSGSPASWGTGKTAATAATFNNSTANAIYEPSNKNSTLHYINEDFSWALWLKKGYSSITASQMWAFTVGRADAGGRGYGLRINSTSAVQAFFGSSAWSISSVPDNEWHHIAFTRSGTAIKIYRDGTLVTTATFSGTLPTYSDGYGAGIGCFHYSGNIYPLIGSIQDFRIYDHALSQKEVAELAKGLMLHYTLDNPYTTGVLNFYSGTNAHGDSSSSSFTKTKLVGEDGYNFKLTRTGTGGNSWPNITFPGISRTNFTAGKKYTWSAKVRCRKWTSGSFALRNSIASNDYTNGSVDVCSTALADGQWHQYSRTITLTEGMHKGSTFYYLTTEAYNASTETSKAYMSPRVEFYSSNQNVNGTLYDMDFDIKEVQLIESDSFPGWVDNTMASNTVRDNTGRGNDATCVGSVTTEGGSPRNTRAFKFIDGTYLQYKLPAGISQCTIAFWIKPTGTNSYAAVDIAKNSPIGNMWLSVNTEASALWAYWGGLYNMVSGSLTIGTWYHVALTFNAGVTQWYLNGEAAGSAVNFSAKGTTWPSGTRTIGDSFTGSKWSGTKFEGSISDWRFYTTILTAGQIKELYNTPISVANTGACLSEQFTEGAAGISFAKTGVVSCNGISSLPGKYDPEVLIEPDGSCWAHIGHHADPTTYKFSSGDPFATGVWKDGRRFLDASYCDLVDKWEFIATQRATATATEQRFRWVQTKNPNVAVYEDVVASAVTKYTAADGYTDMSASHGGIYKFNSNTYYVMTNGTKGDWFGAIGAWNDWNGGIPGINSTAVKDGGHLDLYIRIDNVTFTSSRTGCSLDKGGNGVLSPEFVEQ